MGDNKTVTVGSYVRIKIDVRSYCKGQKLYAKANDVGCVTSVNHLPVLLVKVKDEILPVRIENVELT